MCNHSYKNFSVNKKNHNCKLEECCPNIPMDNKAKCIFHSEQKEWKQENDFVGHIRKYVSYCREKKKKIDLREVYFVAPLGSLVIGYMDTISGANLEGASFLSIIEMKGKKNRKTIPEKLALSNCIFHHDVIFKNCTFRKEIELANSQMINDFGVLNLQFENCVFEQSFDFIDFPELSFHLRIVDCDFKEAVLFQDIYAEDNDFDIAGNTFNEGFCFKSSDISTLVISFSNNTFACDAEFQNVAFRGITLFNGLKVNAKLMFTGSASRKIFYGKTEFEINPKDIEGQIVFQQAQLMVLEASELEVLKKLEKIDHQGLKKVIIGQGCIKYKWQSPLKTLKVGMKNAFIIEEFVRSFTIFLSNGTKKVLGIEILERTTTEIAFFYFSDEDLDANEIDDLLFEGREHFFQIMNGNSSTEKTSIVKSDLLNNFQTKLSQNASLVKIISEIKGQNWTQDDTRALLDAFAFENESVLSAESLHLQLEKVDFKELLQISKQLNIPINLFSLVFNTAESIVNVENMNGGNIVANK